MLVCGTCVCVVGVYGGRRGGVYLRYWMTVIGHLYIAHIAHSL